MKPTPQIAFPPDPIAFSLLRFSTPEQAQGDSWRRQTQGAEEWCQRKGVPLDKSLWLFNPAVSGFTGKHRENPDRHALAAFLKLVEKGKVLRGSYLLIENLDRLTREHIRPALTLLLNLIEAGVRVVQLAPVEMVFDENVEPMALMMAIMELSRGHGESATKSDRLGKAWVTKRTAAREGKPQPPRKKDGRVTKSLTNRLPAWVQDVDGVLTLDAQRVATIKYIFSLAAGGYGLTAIVRKLTREKVPAFGTVLIRPGRKRSAFSGKWMPSYIGKILNDRRVLGELQSRQRRADPVEGAPIANYFPAAVTEEEFHAARAGAAERLVKKGRVGNHDAINVFSGLLRHARDGDAYYVVSRTRPQTACEASGLMRVLINREGFECRGKSWSFPFAIFEDVVLSRLREVNPCEVLGQDTGPDEAMALGGELATVESAIKSLEADLNAHGESPTLYRRLREKEARQTELVKLLAQAQQKAANPLSESWGEFGSLTEALAAAADPEDARLRLRSVLRRITDSFWLLIVPRGIARLVAVQVWFAGGTAHRDYLILYRPPHYSRTHGVLKGGKWAKDFAAAAGLDLRKREDAVKVEGLLQRLDLKAEESVE